jgi:hypothetical protein
VNDQVNKLEIVILRAIFKFDRYSHKMFFGQLWKRSQEPIKHRTCAKTQNPTFYATFHTRVFYLTFFFSSFFTYFL